MISIDFDNLVSFILQYIVATVFALYVYTVLRRRRFYSKPEFRILRQGRECHPGTDYLGMEFFCSLERMVKSAVVPSMVTFSGFASLAVPGSDFRSVYRTGGAVAVSPEFVRRDKPTFKAPSTRVKLPEIFYRQPIYDAYAALFAVSIWAGVLLLLTPYQKIYVFIPHFSSLTFNLITVIILAITIFEGSISTLFFFIGTSPKRVAAVMLSVLAVFSASLLTPSFNWFHNYTLSGELILYTILVVLILGITFLISLLKEKRVLFRLALYSSFVSYGFFITITAYNILATAIGSV